MNNSTDEQLRLIKVDEMKKKINSRFDIELVEEYDIYSEGCIEEFSENDEISAEEEGFMKGYLAA